MTNSPLSEYQHESFSRAFLCPKSRDRHRGILVELLTRLVADGVHHKVIMEVACVNMGCDYHLEAWELFLRKFQTDGVSLLWSDGVILSKGLDEVVELPPARFMEACFLDYLLDISKLPCYTDEKDCLSERHGISRVGMKLHEFVWAIRPVQNVSPETFC